jgi:cell division initiation protein
MKITPIEIRQHSFQKVLRGYDTEEVNAFLSSLSNEWERVSNETKMLKMQLELAEKELNKLREVELTMFRMLKSAEDTSSQMTEQAKVAAEQYIGEARNKAEEVINEARKRGNILLMDAENQAKYAREEISSEFKNYERDFKAMEKYRDNLLVQLKTLANNTVDSVERFEKKFGQNTTKERITELRGQVDEGIKASEEAYKERQKTVEKPADDSTDEETPNAEIELTKDKEAAEETQNLNVGMAMAATHVQLEVIEGVQEDAAEAEREKPAEGSFFDQI